MQSSDIYLKTILSKVPYPRFKCMSKNLKTYFTISSYVFDIRIYVYN